MENRRAPAIRIIPLNIRMVVPNRVENRFKKMMDKYYKRDNDRYEKKHKDTK